MTVMLDLDAQRMKGIEMAKDTVKVVRLKDLVGKLDGEQLRAVAREDLMIQGWERCDRTELADLIVRHVTEDPLKALRTDLVMLPEELHEDYDEMIGIGVFRISKDDEFFDCFADAFYLDLEEVKGSRGKAYDCRMAEEVRKAIRSDPDTYERLLELRDELGAYVNSAAVLYGHVTYKEVCELYSRWHDDGLVDESLVEIVAVDGMEYEPEYIIHHGNICNIDFERSRNVDREIELFLKERGNKPRWYPETEDEFMNWCEETTHFESEDARALEDFLKSHGFANFDRRTELLYEICGLHQVGESPATILSSVSERCKIKTNEDGLKFAIVMQNFLSNMRLRSNNGWTPSELYARESVTAAEKPVVGVKYSVGRNEPCPCGSGKKFKKCCGKN